MERRKQLETLATDLDALIVVLHRDPRCNWTVHLEGCLATARELLAVGFIQEQLSHLSGSVMCIYGGACSFNDYAPVMRVGFAGVLEVVPGMEEVDTLAGKVYQSALALRVTAEA